MEPTFPTFDLPPELSAAMIQAAAASGAPVVPAAGQSLTPGGRVLALARIWSEARFGFAYWDRLPDLDWDVAFAEAVGRALEAPDEAAYWDVLNRFVQLLGDGHTSVWPPERLRAVADAAPPLLLEPVDGLPTVVASAREASAAGFGPGTVVTMVDGVPAADRLRALADTIFSSTDAYRAFTATRRLLSGRAGSSVSVRGETPGGATVEAELPRVRDGAHPWQRRDAVAREEVAPGVFLVDLRTFGDPAVPGAFHTLFPDFAGVRGLILDLRDNGGGSTGIGSAILARLIAAPAEGSAFRLRVYVPTFRAWGRPQPWIVGSHGHVAPDAARPRFEGPAAVLTGPGTASAAEDFLIAWRSVGRGPIVGAATCGSTGQPLMVPLPGGGGLRVCTKRDTYPDGTPFVGVGIRPDVPAARTRHGVAAGRDEVLQAAVAAVLA